MPSSSLAMAATRLLPSGISVVGYDSLTEDVEGQIARGKLKLRGDLGVVRNLLPYIERSMSRFGFVYAHCAIGAAVSSHLSVIERNGHPYRLAIISAARWEPAPTPTFLHVDTDWIEVVPRAPEESYSDRIILSKDTCQKRIEDFFRRIPV